MKAYDPSSNICHQFIEKTHKMTNDLFRDITLAQTLHPEFECLFKHFSSELWTLDNKFSSAMILLGLEGI